MAKNYFRVPYSLMYQLEHLTNKQLGIVFKAILDYQIDGSLPKFKDKELEQAFTIAKESINGREKNVCKVNYR